MDPTAGVPRSSWERVRDRQRFFSDELLTNITTTVSWPKDVGFTLRTWNEAQYNLRRFTIMLSSKTCGRDSSLVEESCSVRKS